jgi:hypothetical protein
MKFLVSLLVVVLVVALVQSKSSKSLEGVKLIFFQLLSEAVIRMEMNSM